jgi:PAS domain-containing protein
MAGAKSIQIILARQLASSVSAPILLVDAEGTLVYYNESAEAIFNRRFDETGEMTADEWTTLIAARDDERNPIPPDERPMMKALAHRRPVSQTISLRRPEGDWRHVHVTAFPLIGERDVLFGAMTIFWEI